MNCYLTLCTEFYDIDKPNPAPEALGFYMRYAEQAKGPILEPMCGSGRFLIPLMQRGFDIEGVDASPHMLAACRQHCLRLGLAAVLHEQLLHELALPRRFGLVIIPAGSFSLVTDVQQVRESLRRIHELVLPGGKFVLETGQRKPATSSSWPWGGRWVQRSDGAKIIISWLGHYDANTSINHNIHRYELVKAGQLLATEFDDFDMRQYSLPEFRELLESAGFEQIRTFKAFDFRPPDDADEEIVIECVKR